VIDAEHALGKAREELQRIHLRGDPLFAPWVAASPGQPVLVRDVARQPSYWVVPVVLQGRVCGFVRVLGTGQVSAFGAFNRNPGRFDGCPATVTGIEADEAARRAQARISPGQGEVASEPVYVHDGPPGREAWLIETFRDGKPSRWLFMTAAFTYERPAGHMRDQDRE
jgi:hypothetical protein